MYWDTTAKSVYIIVLPDKKTFNREKYIKNGIEGGKWHRETIKSLLKNDLTTDRFAIAEFIVEEPCSSVEHGYYMRQNPEAEPTVAYSFLEKEELKLAKTLYSLKGNTDFKLSSPKTVNRLFFASCQSAEAELKKWEKLNIR